MRDLGALNRDLSNVLLITASDTINTLQPDNVIQVALLPCTAEASLCTHRLPSGAGMAKALLRSSMHVHTQLSHMVLPSRRQCACRLHLKYACGAADQGVAEDGGG